MEAVCIAYACLNLGYEMGVLSHMVSPFSSCQTFFFLTRDYMQWSKEEEDEARKKVEENSATRVPPEDQGNTGLL